MIDIKDALEIVLKLARAAATTEAEREACNVVEDMVVNQFGED